MAFAAAAAMFLAGCAHDDAPQLPDVPATPAGGIVVSGGSVGAPLTTRADEPSQPGFCAADRIRIFHYGAMCLGTESRNNMSQLPLIGDAVIGADAATELKLHGNDRYTDYSVSYDRHNTRDRRHTFAVRGLAYTDADAPLFTLTPGATADKPRLDLNAEAATFEGVPVYRTPELYYGNLDYTYPGDILDSGKHSQLDYSWFYCSNRSTVTLPFKGRLRRMVSQLNLVVTKVPEYVTELRLYCNNFPTGLNLYASKPHGTLYRHDIAHAADCVARAEGERVLVDRKATGGASRVALGTFLLPSELGMTFTLEFVAESVHPQTGAVKREEKSYRIEPSASVLVAGLDDDYDTGARLDADKRLYIYDNMNYCFYSYSNIRVNIRGDFDRIVAERGEVEVTVEVEPSFERGHKFELE